MANSSEVRVDAADSVGVLLTGWRRWWREWGGCCCGGVCESGRRLAEEKGRPVKGSCCGVDWRCSSCLQKREGQRGEAAKEGDGWGRRKKKRKWGWVWWDEGGRSRRGASLGWEGRLLRVPGMKAKNPKMRGAAAPPGWEGKIRFWALCLWLPLIFFCFKIAPSFVCVKGYYL